MKTKALTILSVITPLLIVSCYPSKPFAPLQPLEGNATQATIPEVDPNAGLDQQHKKELEKFQDANQSTSDTIKQTPSQTTIPSVLDTTPDVEVENTLPDPTPLNNPIDLNDENIIQPTAPTQTSVTPPPVKKKIYPYARAVEGKPGFVFNPYTSTKIDVRGFASGTLVSAPGDATQKFYVP